MQSIEMLKKLVSYPTVTPKECGIYKYIKRAGKRDCFAYFTLEWRLL